MPFNNIPALSDTAGSYWPTTGTIPKGITYTGLEVSSSGNRLTIQVTANPGVDPIPIRTRPGPIRRGDWIYIPATGQMQEIKEVYQQSADHTLTLTTQIDFSPALTTEPFQVVRAIFRILSVVNNGTAAATVNGNNFPIGQSANYSGDDYVATGIIPPLTYDTSTAGANLLIQVD